MKEDFSFMKESIKDKPFYKKKWVQILCKTIVLAVLFGLISATVFMKIYRQMEKKQMPPCLFPSPSSELQLIPNNHTL